MKIPRLVVLSTGTNDLGLLANETAVLAEAEPLAKRCVRAGGGCMLCTLGPRHGSLRASLAHGTWAPSTTPASSVVSHRDCKQTAAASSWDSLRRVEVIVRYLLAKLPSSDLLLLGLLPRGKNGHLQPSMYTAGINKANNLYK